MSVKVSHKLYIVGFLSFFTLLIISTGRFDFFSQTVKGQDDQSELIQIENDFIRRVPIGVNDIIYNPQDQMLYASRPSSVGTGGNSVAKINPLTGEIISSVFVGSEPGKMALSDNGQTLYTILEGGFSVRRFDIASQTAGIQFSLGRDSDYPYTASDLAVVPGNPDLVAVARYRKGVSPPGGGVAIFSNGVRLPVTGPGHSAGANYLAFSNSPSILYGGGIYDGLRTMTVDGNGVTVSQATTTFGVGRIKFQNNLLYTSSGQVIEPQSRTLLGTFSGASSSAFVPDSEVGRVYYAVRDSATSSVIVKAFDINTFVLIGSLTIPNINSEPSSIVRYGTNGLAMRTSDNQLFLIQTSLIPTSEPIPTPSATPSITPTPTPTTYQSFTRQISLPSKDLIYNGSTQKIYVSVPSSDNTRGNSITIIEPTTGNLENSIFVGSEPGKLALTDDSQTLFVGIDGAGAIRKFDISTQTSGTQFSLGNGGNGVTTAYDIDVMPGSSGTLAVSPSYSYGEVNIYDEGVRRTQPAYASGPIEFDSTNNLYIGVSPVSRYNVTANGMTLAGTIPTSGAGDIKLENGLIYTANGRVIDTVTQTIKGTFSGLGSTSIVTIDIPNNRAFFLTSSTNSSGYLIRAYELDTFLPVGSIPFTDFFYTPSSLVRWGTNGLAFRGDNGKLYLIQSSLVSSSGIVPTPTPTITPTPTPSPVNAPTFVRQINLPANDIVYSAATQSLYATVPSIAGAGRGNTISKINPVNGLIENSVFVGSEPSKMAISSDGLVVYTKLDGAGNAVRRFDIASQSPGLQFTPDIDFQLIQDMKVIPDNPQTLAIAARYNGIAIYDNGVKRPVTSNGSLYSVNSMDFADASTIYGYNNETTGFDLARFTVNSNGVTGVNLGGNIISGFGVQINYENGLIYSTSGRIMNPATQRLAGIFQSGGSAMAVDAASGRVFYLNNNVLTAYDSNTFLKIGSATLPTFTGTPTSLVRWGENGLAFRTINSNSSVNDSQIYVIQSSLVSSATPLPTGIQVASASYYSYEYSSSVPVTISRTGDLSNPSTVDYSTVNGSATGGQDYTAVSGTLNFASGESSKIISVPITNDNIYEGSESFSFELSNATGANVNLVYPNSTTVLIYDNDNQPSVLSSAVSVTEPTVGARTFVNFNIRLSNPSAQTVSVNYVTSNGTAVAGNDYIATSGMLTFAPSETTKTVSVQILGDTNTAESNEVFYLNLSGAVNGTLNVSQIPATIINYNPQTARHSNFDFDGDGRADISVFRQNENYWYLNRSQTGFTSENFGISSDKLVPADYDGDGKTDIAVFRDGTWYILKSAIGFSSVQFGQAGDIPLPGDYDGDGFADIAVWRPADGYWYILNSSTGYSFIPFGLTSDKPVPADYDGDGKTDVAVFREGNWFVQGSSQGFFATQFGSSGDKLVPADYDGDRKTDFAVYRDGIWYILQSQNQQLVIQNFGLATDKPITGDYDGDGKSDIGVFREGNWYLLQSTNGFLGYQFGNESDIPITNVFVR